MTSKQKFSFLSLFQDYSVIKYETLSLNKSTLEITKIIKISRFCLWFEQNRIEKMKCQA